MLRFVAEAADSQTGTRTQYPASDFLLAVVLSTEVFVTHRS